MIENPFNCYLFPSIVALFDMGRACQLMANPHSAQLRFMQALQLIEGSSDEEKAGMADNYIGGKFALGMDWTLNLHGYSH